MAESRPPIGTLTIPASVSSGGCSGTVTINVVTDAAARDAWRGATAAVASAADAKEVAVKGVSVIAAVKAVW